jgi:hypothetical protein
MKSPQRAVLATCAFFGFVAAAQYAVRGIHEPTGNRGYLGADTAGVEGSGTIGVLGRSSSGFVGGLGATDQGAWGGNAAHTAQGILGTAFQGVWAYAACSPNCAGVAATGLNGADGVQGTSDSAFGIAGYTTTGTGVYGNLAPGGTGHAGWFEGRMHVNGTLSKSAGSFKIDHPLDPALKYLSHSFVESPDMKNLYDGIATLDADGTAVVELAEWFGALNENFRYQLTCIGEHAPVYIAEKIHDNHFKIAGGYAGQEISWQVTGSRHDVYAKAHPIVVEEPKAPFEAGHFLHPELYGQPITAGIGYATRTAVIR